MGNQESVEPASPPAEWGWRKEGVGIGLCLALYFAIRFWGLRAAEVNTLFDEGVYLSLMQLQALGRARIYEDIVYGHPPALIWIGAWLWPLVHGSLFALRAIYLCVCALGFIPMYLMARHLRGPRAALLTLFLLCTSPGFANWLGTTLFLELPQNILIFTALWLVVCHSHTRILSLLLAGGLIGASFLIKETAILIGFGFTSALLLAALLPQTAFRPGTRLGKSAWFWAGCGFLVSLVLTVAMLARIPHYWEYFVGFYTLSRDVTWQGGQHLYDLMNGFYALPFPLTFGFLGVWIMARRSRTPEERFLAIFALLMAFLMFFIPRRFYWRYWMTSVPILCLGVAVWWEQFRAVPRPARARGVAFLFLTLFGLVHVISLTLYRTHESPDPPAYREALAILRRSPEPIFTLDNIWAAASGKPLYPWKHIGGDVYGRDKAMRENPQEVYSIIDRSEIVVLDRETTYWTPPHVEAYLRRHYETIFQHEHPKHRRYVEILRRRAAPASR